MIDNNIEKLSARMKIKIRSFLEFLQISGLDVYVFEGIRSLIRQYELFGFGRSKSTMLKFGIPQVYASQYAKPFKKYRTKTIDSNHLIGSACDLVFDLDKDPKIFVPSRNGNRQFVVNYCKLFGLRSLAPMEYSHVEDNGKSIDEVLETNSKNRNNVADKMTRDRLNLANNLLRKYSK